MTEEMQNRAAEEFLRRYGKTNGDFVFCPYRVCLLGAHVDHQHGRILGGAIGEGVTVAYSPSEDGKITVASMNYPGEKIFSADAVPPRAGDWADHLRGAAFVLGKEFPLTAGMLAVIHGSLPTGGLSSSAAVISAFLTALSRVNGISLSADKLMELAKKAENDYVGVNCGILDQACVTLSKKEHLLHMDTLTREYELIPAAKSRSPFAVGVFFSGLERSLVNSDYNNRVAECREAARLLLRSAGYPEAPDAVLRDVPEELFARYADRLPEKLCKRARHYFTENARAEAGAAAWRNGDIEALGRLMTASGLSSVNDYEAGSDELKALSEILNAQPGVYGARFSGAGFKGSCVALMKPESAAETFARVKKDYLALFPRLADKYVTALCGFTNGISEDLK